MYTYMYMYAVFNCTSILYRRVCRKMKYNNYAHVCKRSCLGSNSYFYSERFVDLILDGQAVTVPAKPPLHVETTLVGVTSHHILD